jgi:hypothetical protein
MRILLKVSFPHAKFNEAVRKGTVGRTINRILEDTKPEAVYFTEMDGKRTAILIVNLADASHVPAVAEPWFLQFDADVEFHIAMSGDDLQRAGLEALGKKWS